jgi:REP element-mobilizing transposase RayT
MDYRAKEIDSDFYAYSRNLPHWRSSSAVYFVTWRLNICETILESFERTTVAAALEYFNNYRYWILAYVVMDDHVHIVVRLAHGESLQKTVHGWKSFTATVLQKEKHRVGSVWQHEHYDRIVRNKDELRKTLEYILNNPKKRWPEIAEYAWVRIFDAI